ncbi:Glutaredoxin [Geoglobus ahangari]|uniref:Glutaredoxin n=1 Tax=Geoglobus ahangari TaxID=113653 RepID=A0A0F7IC96_9EURY|nr:glutaredoxin domain-containing protein [Geoglobus ahangari]AKG90858.1 Glutaredoxin [Geoglobus ahangari]NOY10559.1 NrdH-redoxin [Archaeoglobi archaeon]
MIKVYAITTCPYCKKTLKFLRENGADVDVIFLDELDMEKKEMAMREIYSYAGMYAVPVVVHGDRVVVGYDREKLEALLREVVE